MKTLELNYYYDAGHGWLEVPISLIEELGIKDSISLFSYRKNGMAYLEEDCDMPRFLEALGEKKPKITDKYMGKRCWIRNLKSFKEGSSCIFL